MKRALLFLFLLLPVLAWAVEPEETEQVPFNGVVTDLTGRPLKGVKVFLHSEGYYARSDKQGRFGLMNVAADDTLHLRYRKEKYAVPVNGRRSIRIHLGDQLTPQADEDQELASLGYGFVKRREMLQPSSGIKGEDLVRSGYSNLLQALQGRVPGLNITSTGRPGKSGAVSMRGINSLNCPQTPLFVVDDVIVDNIDFINLYDVDYVEVMRDASIYGSRGANGAILVRLKRGNK